MTTTCPACGDPAPVRTLPETAAQAGEVTVRVQGLASVACERGHEAVLPDNAVDLARNAVTEQVLIATRRGLLRQHDACGDCGAALRLAPRRTDRPVPFPAGPQVLTVVIEAPFARCPDCGRDQITDATHRAVEATLTALLG